MDKIKFYLLSFLLYGALIFALVGLNEDHRNLATPASIDEVTTDAAAPQSMVLEETNP